MAGRRKREIRDQDVQGLKFLRKIRPLLSRLRKVGTERDTAGNRRLFMDQYCSLILMYTGEKPNRAMYQMVWYYLIGTRGSLLRSRRPTSQAHSRAGRRGVTPAVEPAYVGRFTGNMASCHFPLADRRRPVFTRASGPDAAGVGAGLCLATVSRRRRRDGGDGATASPQRTSGETVRGNPEPDWAHSGMTG